MSHLDSRSDSLSPVMQEVISEGNWQRDDFAPDATDQLYRTSEFIPALDEKEAVARACYMRAVGYRAVAGWASCDRENTDLNQAISNIEAGRSMFDINGILVGPHVFRNGVHLPGIMLWEATPQVSRLQ